MGLRRRRSSEELTASALQKILMIRLDHLGDVVMSLPAAARVRRAFPASQIDFLIPEIFEKLLTPFAAVHNLRLIAFHQNWFSRNPNPLEKRRESAAILHRLQKEKYDLGIDFRGDLRNILLLYRAGIRFRAGYGATGGGFLLTHCPPYDRHAHPSVLSARLLEALGISGPLEPVPLVQGLKNNSPRHEMKLGVSRLVIIHPGAAHAAKRWPAENFDALILRIRKEKLAHVMIVGDEKEKKEIPLPGAEALAGDGILDRRGLIPLHELAGEFSPAHLFVGNDSGPAHIAAAQGLPVISIFSDLNDPDAWKPWTPRLKLIAGAIRDIPVDTVFDAVKSELAKVSI